MKNIIKQFSFLLILKQANLSGKKQDDYFLPQNIRSLGVIHNEWLGF